MVRKVARAQFSLTGMLPQSTIQIFALTFGFASYSYVVFAFQNISLIQVTLLWILYVGPLIALVLRGSVESIGGGTKRSKLATIAQGLVLAVLFALLLVTGISERWSDYFSNFADERFQYGGGYSIDSAFHVALIEGILDSGFPSTGLHGQPILAYHTLSHYVDAVATFAAGVSPWEGYSLIFVLKNATLILALVFAVTKLAKGLSQAQVLLLAALAYLPLFHLGYLVGSHANWLPAVLVIALFPRIWQRLGSSNPVTWGLLAEMSLYIAIVTLGKVSMGFGLAIFIGLRLLFAVGLGNLAGWFRIVTISVLWLGWFALTAQAFQIERENLDFLERFDRVWPHIWFFIFIVLIHLFIGLVHRKRNHVEAGVVSAITLTVLFLVVTIVVTTKRADVFLFFLASTTITILMSIATFVANDFENRGNNGALAKRPSIALLGALVALLVAGAPLTAETPQLGGFDLRRLSENIRTANSWSFEWYNEGSSGAPLTIWRALQGERISRQETFLGEARAVVRLAEQQSSGERVYVFISSEGFQYLIEEFGRGNLRDDQSADIALMVRAALGAPLVFGSNKERFTDESFGFATYPDDITWMPRDSLTERELCVFGGRVLVLRPDDLAQSRLVCGG